MTRPYILEATTRAGRRVAFTVRAKTAFEALRIAAEAAPDEHIAVRSASDWPEPR